MPAARKRQSAGEKWPLSAVVVVNGLVALVLIVASVLEDNYSDLYYRSAQEDGFLEWATFWAFAIAGAAYLVAGLRQRKADRGFPWFFWGVAAFCVFVAMEEISWGQRLLGYRPPEYFLRENFQQELNIHNVFATSLRKFLLKATILGYGVILPLAAAFKSLRKKLRALGVFSPPLALIPAFAATFVTYEAYPWSFSGEWVEMMLGLGFLGAGVGHSTSFEGFRPGPDGLLRTLVAAAALTAVLAGGSTGLSLLRASDTPEMVAAAQLELEALARDFIVRGRPTSRCGIHKRVYSFVEKYDRDHLYEGAFADLTAQGLPEERARYFLDPWNSPIWVRHKCNDRTRKERLFVYSFGPDRRRDSSSWEILGDDIGVMILERGN